MPEKSPGLQMPPAMEVLLCAMWHDLRVPTELGLGWCEVYREGLLPDEERPTARKELVRQFTKIQELLLSWQHKFQDLQERLKHDSAQRPQARERELEQRYWKTMRGVRPHTEAGIILCKRFSTGAHSTAEEREQVNQIQQQFEKIRALLEDLAQELRSN